MTSLKCHLESLKGHLTTLLSFRIHLLLDPFLGTVAMRSVLRNSKRTISKVRISNPRIMACLAKACPLENSKPQNLGPCFSTKALNVRTYI